MEVNGHQNCLNTKIQYKYLLLCTTYFQNIMHVNVYSEEISCTINALLYIRLLKQTERQVIEIINRL